MRFRSQWLLAVLALVMVFASARTLLGQTDQGTITGVVQDPSGAVIGNASVTLTNVDEGQILKSKTDGAGVYVFSPIKIGNYKVSATATGFETTTQTNLKLSIQQRLNVVLQLKPGATTETVTVTTEAPLMQTQESSVGQTMDTETINSVPLNGRNWVYIAQLSAGTAVADGSRGGGKGDFEANGQRAEENNFILDGVDNNANVVDFYNGASFVVNPPPDALAEFKVQTSSYSAEFGHSAGAVVNASIKSGSNNLHGSAWEYVRNTAFDNHDWNPNGVLPVAAYHDNQFGATLGGPFFKNKLFFFADAQATRITFGESGTYSVPTALMRKGDLSELLAPSLTSDGNPHQVYYQDPSGKAAPVAIPNNDLSSFGSTKNVLNATALKFLNYFPTPNTNGTNTYNNYVAQRPVLDNTFQWDARMDYSMSAKDNAYSRYSYANENGHNAPPLGNILDGGGFGDDGKQKNYGANFMFSETHVFTQTLTNEARFGFNYLHTGFQHPNAANLNFAASVGFGGIPVAPLNGGLPAVGVSGIAGFGSPTWSTTDEHENVYQIIDNITKIWGNHTLKAGVTFQNVRFSTLQPQDSRGYYNYTGRATAGICQPGQIGCQAGATLSNSGSGVADFILDRQHDAGLSNEVTNGDQRWDNAAYVQDDWRVSQKLTVNLGVRWEFFQPYQDVGGYQASFSPTDGTFAFNKSTGYGSGKAQYLIPTEAWAYAQKIMGNTNYSPNYNTVLAEDGITAVSTSNPHLLNAQKTNFAPRLGLAYSPDAKTSVRAGFGIFYGGLESVGYWPNLGENYPFQFTGTFNPPACTNNLCPGDDITIANGYTAIINAGFASNTTGLTMRGAQINPKTTYTEGWNLSLERSLSSNMVATASYVGNTGRHLIALIDANSPLAAAAPGQGSQNNRPFPHSGGSSNQVNNGMSDYSALQAKIEKRMSHGYNLLATYTWSHSIDDVDTPLGSSGDSGGPNFYLVPLNHDYSNSPWDTRQRLTFNGLYDLPFGRGRQYLHDSIIADEIVGGWSINAMFTAQTGNYFTVWPNSISTPDNIGSRALQIGDPYKGGGSVPSNNPKLAANGGCPSSVKNHNHWFNPCAFENPWNAATDHPLAKGSYVTDPGTILGYVGGRRNQIAGPGYDRVNASIFKDFNIFREQKLNSRADIFNVLNSPALGNPNDSNIDEHGGRITGTRGLQRYSPDSRFIQLSAKYSF